MKTLTSAAANKWIKSLEDEKSYYLSLEESASVYTLSEGEITDPPEYDYQKVNGEIKQIDATIRKIKHAVNVFNTTTVLPELGITVDEALVKMAQLNLYRNKLDIMRRRLPKERVDSFSARAKTVIEYQYTDKRPDPTDEVKAAVSAVFDDGETVTDAEILYFYAPELCESEWHESQEYVMTVGGHRFFKEG